MKRGALLLCLMLSACDSGGSVPSNLRVVDGDTFKIGSETIRIKDMDTAELNGKCRKEIILARQAKALLEDILSQPIRLVRDGEDRYGRTLAVVYAGG